MTRTTDQQPSPFTTDSLDDPTTPRAAVLLYGAGLALALVLAVFCLVQFTPAAGHWWNVAVPMAMGGLLTWQWLGFTQVLADYRHDRDNPAPETDPQ